MSIEAMISAHPDVGNAYNESLGRAVKHAMYCSAICNSCADACLAESINMSQCVRLCLDCSDVCGTTARVAMRRTGSDRQLIRSILAVCIEICERCAAECGAHKHDHCQRCAAMCRECAEDCRTALKDLSAEVHAEA